MASKQAFVMMKQFFGTDYATRQVVAAEKDTLELGKHTLNFLAAPMVHWPEIIMTYDSADKVLFTADGFGKFGALDAAADAEWDCEARRYYFGIVGKYGAPGAGSPEEGSRPRYRDDLPAARSGAEGGSRSLH